MIRHLRRRKRHESDAGFSLVELIVAMGIFSVLLAVFGAAVVTMTKDTVAVQDDVNATAELQRAMNAFDRQLRYSSGVNRPVLVGGQTWYLEYLIDATAPGVQPTCTQWRVSGTTDLLETRTWVNDTSGATVTPTAWTTVASRITNDPATQPPFVLLPADATYTKQRLTVWLLSGRGSQDTQLKSTFVARNTSISTSSNADNDGNGVSDNQVCTQVGRP